MLSRRLGRPASSPAGNIDMGRSRLFRFRDRGSYKSSEVVALFLLSLFGGAIMFLLCMVVDWFLRTFFGIGTGS